jgi:Trk K+ transport system NAD-binding subunit
MEKTIVLCGLGRVGWRVLEYLQAANLPVVIIDTTCRADDPRLRGVRFVSGDCRRRDILEAAGIEQAGGVLILTGDDLVNISAALMVRALNPDVRIVLRMFNQNLMGRLGQAVRNVFALSTSMLTAPILAMTAMTGQGLGAFRLEHESDGLRQVAELQIHASSKLYGQMIATVGARVALVLAHLPRQGTPKYLLDVNPETRLAAEDRLIVCGEPHALAPLFAESEGGDAPHLLWAGFLRRWGRILQRSLAEVDRAVLLCTLVFVTVVLTSTLILHFGVEKYTPADALLHTLSIMSVGGNLHEDDYPNTGTKLFVSVLRVTGVALMGLFTAIVTNYLLRARLGGALEAARIPDKGHFIVCGLSPIGFRVVEELIAAGEQVVVIEVDTANRFVATVRRLRAAVIIGDATVAEVLRQARASEARAVIAATSHDLMNLEIALLVRERNAVQRVVLLMADPQLAQMLRDAANVRLAVSVPTLVAPAFLAALYGDRVLSVFLVRGHLLAVIDLVVQENDPLVNQKVSAVAADYRLLPAAVIPKNDSPPTEPMTAILLAGDRLVAIIALHELERLLRRQPAARADKEMASH